MFWDALDLVLANKLNVPPCQAAVECFVSQFALYKPNVLLGVGHTDMEVPVAEALKFDFQSLPIHHTVPSSIWTFPMFL